MTDMKQPIIHAGKMVSSASSSCLEEETEELLSIYNGIDLLAIEWFKEFALETNFTLSLNERWPDMLFISKLLLG